MTKAAAAKTESRWPDKLDKKLWPKIPKAEWWAIDRIKPYVHNPRTHPPAQVDLLARLVRKFGPDQPIVVDENAEILKGHGRREAAILGELGGFWVIQRAGMTDAEKRAMRIQDNAVPLMSGWDNELVRLEMHALKTQGFDLEMLGFGKTQLVQFTATPGPPAGGFPAVGEDIATEHQCPRCSYRWSGPSAPAPEPKDETPPKGTAKTQRKARSAGGKRK